MFSMEIFQRHLLKSRPEEILFTFRERGTIKGKEALLTREGGASPEFCLEKGLREKGESQKRKLREKTLFSIKRALDLVGNTGGKGTRRLNNWSLLTSWGKEILDHKKEKAGIGGGGGGEVRECGVL